MPRLRFFSRPAAATIVFLLGAGFAGCEREVIELLEIEERSGRGGGDSGIGGMPPGGGTGGMPPGSGTGGMPPATPDGSSDGSVQPAPPAGCATDSDCGPDLPACDPVQGVCVRCVDWHHCEGSWERQCDPVTHECVECLRREDCPPDLVCDALTSRCARPCTFNEQCFGLTCDPSRGICVECLVNEDCNRFVSQATCADGRCVMCVDDGDCAGTDHPFCDARLRSCVRCIDDRHCPPGQHCQFDGECR